jgi:hypothetical protein
MGNRAAKTDCHPRPVPIYHKVSGYDSKLHANRPKHSHSVGQWDCSMQVCCLTHVSGAAEQHSRMEKEMSRMRRYGKAVESTLHTRNHTCEAENLVLRHVCYSLLPVVTVRTARFNIHKFHVLPTQCVYVFCVDLRTIIKPATHVELPRQKKR